MPSHDLLELTVPVAELIARGSLMYLFLFAIFRFVLRRDAGTVGISDFLLVVIVADASQNSMIGDGRSVPGGMVLVATLVAWNYAFDWLAFRFEWFRRLAEPAPVVVVRNGRRVAQALRREFITTQELEAKMRSEGIGELRQVRKAMLEPDGNISFIKAD